MRSTFSGLEIARRSLFAQQTALQTTGHNIANANTLGYTRQVVNLSASRPMEAIGQMRSTTPGQIGTGVEFDSIKRIREKYLDTQYYNENQSFGSWSIRKDSLEKLEAIINEPSDTGLTQVTEEFWNAWQVLSREPENLTARAALKESAVALSETFNHIATQLNNLRQDLTENISVKVREVNSLLDQVSRLNHEIFRVEGLGNNANDLRDHRDLLVDHLSKIINVRVEETAGGYNISMGGLTLVDGINVINSFSAGTINPGGIEFEDAFNAGHLTSGEVHGMLVSRDQYLESYQFQFDSMVKALVEGEVEVLMPAGSVLPPGTVIGGVPVANHQRVLSEDTYITVNGINGLHQLGYTLDDPPQSGLPFFTLKTGYTQFSAASIQVNPDIVNKVSNIAASARVVINEDGSETLVKGNNSLALLMANLRNTKLNFDESASGTPLLTDGTFDEFFRAIVGQLGVQTQEAIRQTYNQQVLVEQVDSRRQSVSGVSLDEEMVNMMKYQHAYNAAARVMTSYDELLNKVINGMGIVGR